MHTILKGLLAPEAAAQAVADLARLPAGHWEDGRASAGAQAAAVKSNLQLPHAHPLAATVRDHVLRALDASDTFLAHALPARILPPRVNRYDPAHPAYGWHTDTALRLRADGQTVRTDLSCTVMLSEPGSYDGGELVLQDGDVRHTVRLAAGDAVLYRSGVPHEVRPVTRGCRLACFFWVQSHVPGDTERALLQQLDRHLVALRNRHGETDETRGLMSVYHGLLRLWAR
jgi:PKHD-type hydroxylase